MVSTQHSVARNSFIVAILMGMSTVLGLIRESSVAFMFGASWVTDSYLIAMIIPTFISGIISSSITYTFVTVYSSYLAHGKPDVAQRMSNVLISFLLILLSVLLILSIFFTSTLIKLVAPSYIGQQLALTVSLTRIMIPTLFFGGLIGVFVGINNSHYSFFAPASIGLVSNIIIIFSIYVFGSLWGIYGLAAGVTMGSFAQLLLQIPAVCKHGFHFKFVLDLQNEGLREVLALLSPFIVAAAANQVYLVVDRTIATGLPSGSVSALYFANRLVFLPYGIITGALGTVIYPVLVNAATLQNWEKFVDEFQKAIRLILLILIPLIIELYLLRVEFIRILFQHGLFSAQEALITASTVPFFLGSLFFGVLVSLLVNLYFSTKNMFLAVGTGVIAVLINIVLCLLLAPTMHQYGLALANSLSSFINFILLFMGLFMVLKLHKKVKVRITPFIKLGGQLVIAGLIMVISILILMSITQRLPSGKVLVNIIPLFEAGLGLIIYTLVIYSLKVEEIRYLINRVVKKGH